MKCIKVQDLLPAYIEGKLAPGKRDEIDSHIRQCGECSEFLREFNKTAGLLETRQDIELPAGYLGRLNAKLNDALTAPRSYRPWVARPSFMLPVFAALLILAGVDYYLTEQKRQCVIPGIFGKQDVSNNKNIPSQPAREASAVVNKTITLAKLPSEYGEDFVLRGTGAVPVKKKILMQWKDLSANILETGCAVIRSSREWDDLWLKLGRSKPSAEIDFSRNRAIAVFNDSGSITITAVKETGNKYYLEITETAPGKTKSNIPGQPYHIVVVENNN